jgi:hypothetical protein
VLLEIFIQHPLAGSASRPIALSRLNDMALKVLFKLYNRWDVVKIELYAVYEVKLRDVG